MRQNNTIDPGKAKKLARQKYSQRQIDKWIRWSLEIKGKIKWKELVEIQDEYKIKVE
jgi:accessory colonization factor AcfC